MEGLQPDNDWQYTILWEALVVKYLLPFIVLITMLVTGIELASAHEFEDLGVMVRHKENKISLISAPPLSVLEINAKGEALNFDSNGDGEISFQEILVFEDEITKRVEQLIIFKDDQGRAAKLKSFRLLEKGYENLLKIQATNEKNRVKEKQLKSENDKSNYIQLLLKFEWDETPHSINLHYDMLKDETKYVLVRNQNSGQSQVLELVSSKAILTIFPINSATSENTKAIWMLGIKHVLEGLDHLLFILALTVVCKSLSGLIIPLSAFTIAHSFALVLVALGFKIGFPSWAIEAAIAMTIVIMAMFEFLGWKPKHLFLATALMGVIHGFGLGQALTDSLGGVEGWATALVQMTLGIELAQLAIALICLTILINFPKLTKVSKKMIDLIVSVLIICTGLFWTMERLLS